MSRIKTRENADVFKALDKSAALSERMHGAFVRTKQEISGLIESRTTAENENSTDNAHARLDDLTHDVADLTVSTSRRGIERAGEFVRNRIEARREVKTVEAQTKQTVRTVQHNGSVAAKRAAAKSAAIKKMRMAKVSGEAVRKTSSKAKAAAKATAATVKAILAAAKSLIVGLMAGGWVAVLAVVTILLIAAIAASPFGILYSRDSADKNSIPATAAIAQINGEFGERIAALQACVYDGIELEGAPADWADVLAVFAVKISGAEDGTAEQVAVLDTAAVRKLQEVFFDMTDISSYVEQIHHADSDPNDDVDDSWTENILHITVEALTADEAAQIYSFSTQQKELLAELLMERDMLQELTEDLQGKTYEAKQVVKALPEDISEERREIVTTACSLVGKVNYFWGGKSLADGWDTNWGTLQKVAAANNSTTGTYRPFGLDCSGYVDWVFYNATGHTVSGGNGAEGQHDACAPITWEDAQPGDLVFYPDDEHVGIVVGKDDHGELLVAHCPSAANRVVITGADGFISVGRVVA